MQSDPHHQIVERPCPYPIRALFSSLLLVLAACAVPPTIKSREYPLVAGASASGTVRRVDVDERRAGPPPVSFDVDCTALPYAKGEEHAFCYKNGHWAVMEREDGTLVGCSCGEFGGFVLWYGKGGELLQTLASGHGAQSLVCDGEALFCITGLTHLTESKGRWHSFKKTGDRWTRVDSYTLIAQVERLDLEPDGGLLLELKFGNGTFRYRAGELEQCLVPLLGAPFGRAVTIEAYTFADDPAEAGKTPMLHVQRIDGRKAPFGLRIAWTYGGWFAERGENAGHKGFVMDAGVSYQLRGYEAGEWTGTPRGAWDLLTDDAAPPQASGFRWKSIFRVVAGDRITTDR